MQTLLRTKTAKVARCHLTQQGGGSGGTPGLPLAAPLGSRSLQPEDCALGRWGSAAVLPGPANTCSVGFAQSVPGKP